MVNSLAKRSTSLFNLIPLMVAHSLLVLTSGRLFCSRYLNAPPLKVPHCPAEFPPLDDYQLWHELTHQAPLYRWFRDPVKTAAGGLRGMATP